MHDVIIPTGNCQNQQGWHPIAVKKKKNVKRKKKKKKKKKEEEVVEYLLLCVARTLMLHLL